MARAPTAPARLPCRRRLPSGVSGGTGSAKKKKKKKEEKKKEDGEEEQDDGDGEGGDATGEGAWELGGAGRVGCGLPCKPGIRQQPPAQPPVAFLLRGAVGGCSTKRLAALLTLRKHPPAMQAPAWLTLISRRRERLHLPLC